MHVVHMVNFDPPNFGACDMLYIWHMPIAHCPTSILQIWRLGMLFILHMPNLDPPNFGAWGGLYILHMSIGPTLVLEFSELGECCFYFIYIILYILSKNVILGEWKKTITKNA